MNEPVTRPVGKDNIYGIIGLILAIVLSPVGIIISAIGIAKQREYTNCNGLAVAGVIVGIVLTGLRLALIVTLLTVIFLL